MPPELRLIVIHYLLLLISIVLHEWAHAYTADRLGDRGPRMDGRVTLNPAAHFDLFGTLVFPLIFLVIQVGNATIYPVMGWGKWQHFSSGTTRKGARDETLIVLAGPMMNLLLAIGAAVLGGLASGVRPDLMELAGIVIAQNAFLFAFNLLPVPPLDGGYLLKRVVGMSEERFMQLSGYCFFILLAINFTPLRLLYLVPANGVIAMSQQLMALAAASV